MSIAEKKTTTVKSADRGFNFFAEDENRRTIEVEGQAERRLQPNVAVVGIVVETRDPKSSSAAQAANATKSKRVLAAVKRVSNITILRTDPSLSVVETEPERGASPRIAYYSAMLIIKLETTVFDQIGALIDAAASAGENVRIDDVTFGLTPDTTAAERLTTLAEAADDAKARARILANKFNATIVGVRKASQVVGYRNDGGAYRHRASFAVQTESAQAVVTPISPTQIEMYATVSLIVDIAHEDETPLASEVGQEE